MNQAAPGGGGGGGTGVHLSTEAAAHMIAAHQRVAKRVTDLSGSIPAYDAGPAADVLALILGSLLQRSIDLATVSSVCATQLLDTVNDLATTDETIARAFQIDKDAEPTSALGRFYERPINPAYGALGQPGLPGQPVTPLEGVLGQVAPPTTGTTR